MTTPFQEDAIQTVVDAWTIEGPSPRIHQKAKEKLYDLWPVLWYAVDALAKAMRMHDSQRDSMISGLLSEGIDPAEAVAFADAFLEYASATGRLMRAKRELQEAEEVLERLRPD